MEETGSSCLLVIFLSVLVFSSKAAAQQIHLDCRADYTVMFGVPGYPTGYKQSNSMDPISVVLDRTKSTLEWRGIPNIEFKHVGSIVEFEIAFPDGTIVHTNKIDLVTKRLEYGIWGQNVDENIYYPNKDDEGRSLVEQNIFHCERVEPLF